MLSEEENKYVEKWTSVQIESQFQRKIILSLVGIIGLLALIILFAGQNSPLVVEKSDGVFKVLSITRENVAPTKEAVAELVSEFIRLRYEWPKFDPEQIIKNIEPLTTEGLRSKLLQEFGGKAFQNKQGSSIEQSVARIKPDISDKAILASFDRILRINGVPVVVPTQVSILLAEGPKTAINPVGLYINGVIEHEDR